MGSTLYSFSSRMERSTTSGYHTKSVNEIFTQNVKRQIHESMEPSKALIRESRDSDVHPNSVPIILTLDLTGSMLDIPKQLIKDGLPNIMQGIIQKGVLDPQILFLGIGDHESDRYPLQVGQFESGDLELDTWLTRTYLEGGGGSNAGESYLLAWYFAAFHTVTDSFEKRGKKGFLFTIGDEPCLPHLPANVVESLIGKKPQSAFTAVQLLELAKEKYEVYHLHVMQGSAGSRSLSYWTNLLGQNCVTVKDHTEIPNIVSKIVTEHSNFDINVTPNVTVNDDSSSPVNIIL